MVPRVFEPLNFDYTSVSKTVRAVQTSPAGVVERDGSGYPKDVLLEKDLVILQVMEGHSHAAVVVVLCRYERCGIQRYSAEITSSVC